MAPMKRSSAQANHDEGEEYEVIGVESARSSLRQDSRKKPRLSYEDADDNDVEEESDEDEFEQATQQHANQQRKKQHMDNVPADNGILESVTCTNFMCHGHLEVTLCPLINFIIGHNGSGKSAVLTAITICLGGKATATNRGQSLKNFIKEGEESALLSVKIKNKGVAAYQQEVYGDSIIVERGFSRSGASGFKLKSSTGRLISTRKFDLDEICDYYALQIDNPMNVLTQDMARQFLNTSDASDKYKFFMKGTQLEHLDADYRQMEESIDQIEDDLEKVDRDVERYREDADKKRKLLAMSEKQNTLRYTIRDLGRQMAWAQVEEQERRLAHYEEKLREAQNSVADAERRADQSAEAFETANRATELTNAAVQDAQNDLNPLNEEKAEAKSRRDQAKNEGLDFQAQQREIRNELKAAESRVRKTEDEIDEEHRRLRELDGGSHARRLEEIEAKKIDAADAKAHFHQHQAGLRDLEERKRRAEEAKGAARGPITSKRAEIRECEERLQGLIRDRGKQQGAYNANMPRLLKAIEQDRNFRQRPVGPIGKHLRLTKPKWSSILEKSFGGTLTAFVVTSKEDQGRLSALMRQVNCQCPILIGNNTPINVADHEPDPAFDTTLRVLEIDNDLVMRQLVISQSIEQTILVENRSQAVDLMNNSRLPNVKQCFTMNVRAGEGLRLTYGYGGNAGSNYVAPFKGTPRMGTDIEYQIQFQRQTLDNLKSELHELENKERELQRQYTECSQALTRHGRESTNLRIAMQKAEDLVGQLQDAIDADQIEEGRLEALKVILKEAEEEKQTHEGSYGDCVVSLDRVKDSMRIVTQEMTSIDKRIEEATAKLKKTEAKASKATVQRQKDLQQKNLAINAVQDAKDHHAQVERKRENQGATVTSYIEQATEISARIPVPPGETAETLDNKLGKLNKDLERGNARLGASPEKITQDVAEAMQLVQAAESQYRSMKDLAQLLKMTLLNRKERWRIFQKKITARARIQFGFLLSERNFRGRLKADHSGKTLDLSVEPDATRMKSQGRKTLTLSGGEKSFSTTCLLLSLWDAMGAPVRCLDEFDVFMDSANREVSLDLITKAARDSIGKQFIFITPGVMSNIREAPDVKVIRMRDPERGQTTLRFPDQDETQT